MSTETAENRDPNPGSWQVRVVEPPEMVCPPWCQNSQEEHLAGLWDFEGFVIHHGADDEYGWGLIQSTTPYGNPAPGQEGQVRIWAGSDNLLTADEAETRAHAILELVKEARA